MKYILVAEETLQGPAIADSAMKRLTAKKTSFLECMFTE
jgi:hypothetical protein